MRLWNNLHVVAILRLTDVNVGMTVIFFLFGNELVVVIRVFNNITLLYS